MSSTDKIEWRNPPPGIKYGDVVFVDLYRYYWLYQLGADRQYVEWDHAHTYLGKDSTADQWAISTKRKQRLTFVVEEAKKRRFRTRRIQSRY